MAADPRFAIYFVPAAASALYRFGASVLGYDCYTGEAIAHPQALPEAEWAKLTAEPTTYGFHATLKAPFRLRREFEPRDLLAAAQALAASLPPPSRRSSLRSQLIGWICCDCACSANTGD